MMADSNKKNQKPNEPGREYEGLNPLYLASQQSETSDDSKDEINATEAKKNNRTTDSTSPSSAFMEEGNTQNEVDKTGSWKPMKSVNDRQNKENDEEKEADVQEQPVEIVCPRVNCPEKIIICFDMSTEMETISFRSRSGDKFAPLGLLKRALGIFLHTKHQIDARHEFALVILHHTAYWMCDFTNDPEKLLTILEDNQRLTPADTFDLADIFKEIYQHVELPKIEDPYTMPPPYTVRVLLLYGRSHCVPGLSNKEYQNMLEASHHFFLDAYYIHEPPAEDNQCEEIFDLLCDLDTKGLSYVFEVSRNPTRLYDCIAQLLPHPLQRPLQKDVSYTLSERDELAVQ